MIIEEVLYAYLTNCAGLTALVGDRIYPIILPQKISFPAVTYQRISGIREYSQSGPSGLAHPRFQFSCWAKKYQEAKAIAEQVRLALDGYKGMMGGPDGVRVDAVYIEDDHDIYDPETKIYHIALDVVIWHEEVTA